MVRTGVLLFGMLLASWAIGADAPAPAPIDPQASAVIEDYCLGCHSGRRAKAGLDLARLRDEPRAPDWSRVRRMVGRREMPPEGKEQPSEAERAALLAWLDSVLPPEDASTGEVEPGRVTLRRLNRDEYGYALRDLLGVDLDVRAVLPADDTGEGFDQVGEVLSMAPAAFERYVDLAERAAALAFPDPDAERPAVRRFEASELKVREGGRLAGDGRVVVMFSNGAAGQQYSAPRAGEYVLRAFAAAQQAGPEPARMVVGADGEAVETFDVRAEPGRPEAYATRIRLAEGGHLVGAAFVNDYYKPDDPDPRQRDRNLLITAFEVEGPVDRPSPTPAQRRWLADRPSSGDLPRLTASIGRLVWRRPLDEEDVAGLVALAGTEGTVESRLRAVLVAMLASPRFLFRIEDDAGFEPGAVRPLAGWERATRLAAFLWSSVPDEALLDAAEGGALEDDDGVRAQVRRMLADPRASRLATRFAAQWLRIADLDRHEPDRKLFPDADPALLASMRAETELFFDAVLREARPISQLIDADFTYLDERLAAHYGIPGVRGATMRRVPVDRARRGGVLCQASVLTATSNPTRTSPVKRGKWVLEVLLDSPVPPPPPGVGALDPGDPAMRSLTLREQLARHRRDPDCAACHARLDPPGLGLERYDAVGRWRETEAGRPLDATGRLADGRTFEGPAGLKEIVLGDPGFPRALAKSMLTFALGRGLRETDGPAVARLVRALDDEPTLPRLIREIATLPCFLSRRTALPVEDPR